MLLVVTVLSLGVVGAYLRMFDPSTGWTRLVDFGEHFAPAALPRLQRAPHHIVPRFGNDGQFYAQVAIDPSVQDPGFEKALDEPAYRARRIGVPALSFCLGWGKPRRVIQAYALSNLLFWFVLAGALVALARPWTGKQMACVAAALLSFGVITSMEHAMIDLPTTALVFLGVALSSWSRYAAFAAAALTRETSVLAALAGLDLRRPFGQAWKRNLAGLMLATLPVAVWVAYVGHRFDGLQTAAGVGNFGLPLQGIWGRWVSALRDCAGAGLQSAAKDAGPFGWLYLDETMHEALSVVSLFCQGLYLVLRRDWQSTVWRTGFLFVLLGAVFGSAPWDWTGAAARVLLPMTMSFYLRLAREDDPWFWPFFVLGSLSVPFGVYEFWHYV